MKLESLPNEIFLDLFDYFDGNDLLRAFYDLNSRFNLLLYKQYHSYRFQLNSIRKRHFDMICHQHLPLIANQVIALQFSDDIDTPEQIHLFLSYIPSFKSFIHLQSLTISHLHSYQLLVKLLDECQYLPNLTHLSFASCSFRDSSSNSQWIIDQIWRLPTLIDCRLGIVMPRIRIFSIPTILSKTLERVITSSYDLQWSQLTQLIEYTPRLKYLSTNIKSFSDDNYSEYALLTLTKCKIHFSYVPDIPNTNISFRSMPNLHHLDAYISDGIITGHQWEYIIRNYLPRLKKFRLRMEKEFLYEEHFEQEADELIESFRTSFWIDEHQWFVRCFTTTYGIYLNTLHKRSHDPDNLFLISWRSTHPNDDQQEFYNNITRIDNKIFFDQSISSDIRLPNLKYLQIKLPINDRFWTIVPNLNQLKKLFVFSYVDTYSTQLQRLLDQASHLHELCIEQDAALPLQTSLFTHTSSSICQLDLSLSYDSFNENECLRLTRSSLTIQCEVLSIRVKNYQSIIHLASNMPNLRLLTVTYDDNQHQTRSKLTEYDNEAVALLKRSLPSIFLIVKKPYSNNTILIWI